MASRDTRITPKALDKTACINSPKQTQTHTYAHTAVICKCNWLRHVPLHHTLLIVLVFLSFKSQTCIDSFKTLTFCLGEKQKEIIYFTVEIGSFYVNVKSAGEKWTRANFHHHCLVVSLLPTVHINNRNIYFITFLHLFINCPALFPFITILNMQKNANGNRDVSVRKDWTV